MRILTTTAVLVAMAATTSVPMVAQAGPRHFIKDRVEDRIDRRENRRDEAVNHGPRDRIEDHLDRWEDRRDRRNLPVPGWMTQWERESWWRLWGQG